MAATITDGTDVSTVVRTNHARNAMPVGPVSGGAVPGFAVYLAGTGEVGATTVVAPGGDGPVINGQALGYARRTVTTPKTGSSTGWAATNSAYRLPLSGDASSRVTVSLLARFTAASDPGAIHRAVRLRGAGYTSGGVAVNNTDTAVVNLPMNEWLPIPVTYVPTGEFVTFGWWLYQSTGSNLPAASTLDVAGLMIEDGATATTWFYGATPADGDLSYRFAGAENASASQEILTVPNAATPDLVTDYGYGREARTIVHPVLGASASGLAVPDVTLRAPTTRTGMLAMLCATRETATDVEAMHLTARTLTLTVDDEPTANMAYVATGPMAVEYDADADVWWVRVTYAEVAA